MSYVVFSNYSEVIFLRAVSIYLSFVNFLFITFSRFLIGFLLFSFHFLRVPYELGILPQVVKLSLTLFPVLFSQAQVFSFTLHSSLWILNSC